MIQEQGDGYTTIGQSHARMLLDWAVAAAATDSGNGGDPEGTPVGKGRRSWDVARVEVLNIQQLETGLLPDPRHHGVLEGLNRHPGREDEAWEEEGQKVVAGLSTPQTPP